MQRSITYTLILFLKSLNIIYLYITNFTFKAHYAAHVFVRAHQRLSKVFVGRSGYYPLHHVSLGITDLKTVTVQKVSDFILRNS